MAVKVCNRCGVRKPATTEFFYRDIYEEDVLTRVCKVCINEAKRKRREDPEYRRTENERRRQYRETHKEQITAYRKANQEKITKQQSEARRRRALARLNEPRKDG